MNDNGRLSEPPLSPDASNALTKPESTSAESDRRRYILIIEDDKDVRDTIDWVLSDAGYRVKTAMHGKEALKILEVDYITSQYIGDPLVPLGIILDLMMPVMNGWEFYAELRRNHPAFDSVRVIVVSADPYITEFTDWAVHREGLLAADDGITKPLGLDELVLKVRRRFGDPSGTFSTGE